MKRLLAAALLLVASAGFAAGPALASTNPSCSDFGRKWGSAELVTTWVSPNPGEIIVHASGIDTAAVATQPGDVVTVTVLFPLRGFRLPVAQTRVAVSDMGSRVEWAAEEGFAPVVKVSRTASADDVAEFVTFNPALRFDTADTEYDPGPLTAAYVVTCTPA